MSENKLPLGSVVRVTKSEDGKYTAMTVDGTDVTDQFENYQLRNAVKENMALKLTEAANGPQWRKVSPSEFSEKIRNTEVTNTEDHGEIMKMIKGAAAIRPETYKMNDLLWRFAVRTVLRGKNLMAVGPKGGGKTMLAYTLAEALGRTDRFFNIPMGSTQDPQSVLIGNTHFSPATGTFTALSEFARAIQVPNALILLDELTRAHPDAWNILMNILDYKQRFLRVDSDPNTPTIPVAPGVTFIATANIGASYTATRTLDSALVDRFIVIEVEPLGKEQEFELLKLRFPQVNLQDLSAIANIAADIRADARSADPRLSEILSTRSTLEMAELLYDGFTLEEACDLVVYPIYDESGGTDSARAHVRMIVQKHLPNRFSKKDSPFDLDKDTDDSGVPWVTK